MRLRSRCRRRRRRAGLLLSLQAVLRLQPREGRPSLAISRGVQTGPVRRTTTCARDFRREACFLGMPSVFTGASPRSSTEASRQLRRRAEPSGGAGKSSILGRCSNAGHRCPRRESFPGAITARRLFGFVDTRETALPHRCVASARVRVRRGEPQQTNN